MAIVIGDGTITGVSQGGFPANIVTVDTLADGTITGADFAQLMASSGNYNGGYCKLPSGIIFQFGYTANAASSFTFTFPLAFPSACLSVQVADLNSGDIAGIGDHPAVNSYSTTSTNISVTSRPAYVFAIGY